MNSLTWIVYLAQVLPNSATFSLTIAFITGIITGIYLLIKAINRNNFEEKPVTKMPFIVLIVCFIIGFLSQLVPSKNTIYLMAGSEAAEAVAATEEGKQIIADVKQIIRKQLETMK